MSITQYRNLIKLEHFADKIIDKLCNSLLMIGQYNYYGLYKLLNNIMIYLR